MSRSFDTRLVVQSLLVSASIFAVYGFSPDTSGEDPLVQHKLYSHLDYAARALERGNSREAVAYAEMVLLRREITIFVDDKDAPSAVREDAVRALRAAAVNWEDALNREIKFRFVPFRDADVTVQYTGDMRYNGKDAAGTVRWTRHVMSLGSGEYRYEVRANITLRTHTPKGDVMNYGQMLHTAGHELGHVLGLEDTGKAGSLMGPLRLDRPVERATKAERESLLSLRKLASDLLARVHATQQDALSEEPRILILVVSEPAVALESKRHSARDDRGQRRVAVVRSPLRDGQAESRKKAFKVTGLGR